MPWNRSSRQRTCSTFESVRNFASWRCGARALSGPCARSSLPPTTGLMIVVAFWPDALHVPLSEGRVVTIGVPIGAAIILLSWLLTGLYVYRANTAFDALNEQILREARP